MCVVGHHIDPCNPSAFSRFFTSCALCVSVCTLQELAHANVSCNIHSSPGQI